MDSIKTIFFLFLTVLLLSSCLDEYRGDDPGEVEFYNLTEGAWLFTEKDNNVSTAARVMYLCTNAMGGLTFEINEDGTGRTCSAYGPADELGGDSITWTSKKDTMYWNMHYARKNQKFTLEFLHEDTLRLTEH